MAESACLMQQSSVSHASSETALRRHIQQAEPIPQLEGSISFGRFASESLDWGKWSSFSHNRRLEEVQKYSTPGSVAQKKAYFEAHYKRIAAQKAEALFEQSNAEAEADSVLELENHDEIQNASTPDSDIVQNSNSSFKTVGTKDELVESKSKAGIDESDQIKSNITEIDFLIEAKGSYSDEKPDCLEKTKAEEPEVLIKENVPIKTPKQIQSSSQLEAENHNRQWERPLLKEKVAPCQDNSATRKKKCPSLVRVSLTNRVSKLPPPAKPATPIHPKQENSASPNSKKSLWDSMQRKRSTPKSLHMSINFGPCHISETTTPKTKKRVSPIPEKHGVSKIALNSPKLTRDSSNVLKTPATVQFSESRTLKLSTVTPKSESRRSKDLLEHITPRSRKTDWKWQSLSVDRSQPSTTSGNNTRSPIVLSPFHFRSEERAAKRKEYFQKLEEKFNAKEEQKVQLQQKSKEGAESEIKKLRQSVGFKAKPMPNFYRETETKNQIKKVPLTQPKSPKLGRAKACVVHDKSSLVPPRPRVKGDGTQHVEKKNQMQNHHLTSSRKKRSNAHENASPNIQL